MFYLIEVEDYVRVTPELFGMPTMEAVEKQLEDIYDDYYSKEMGQVVKVIDISEVGEGVIIPGDGAAYYNSKFKLLVWKPELHELVYGEIAEITNFGAFINMGPMKGMIHISQTMDDYVSFSESESLLGKATGRNLKKGDQCLARVVALSHKGDSPKIGLTMRQPGLGKLDWIEEERQKRIKEAEKANKQESKDKSKKK
ncbi:MAG TPA: DNA-directed RNA polymerase [Candidatus Nanoarchaeia archaeon]|nr:DNA-directed RNA polymerase [Candidatus Nanoarchaeia archaeon]